MAKKATKKASPKVERDQYFEGMEPPKITELDKAIAVVEQLKADVASLKLSLDKANVKLQQLMHKYEPELEKSVDGTPRYLARELQLVATLVGKEESVKVKKAPKPKVE